MGSVNFSNIFIQLSRVLVLVLVLTGCASSTRTNSDTSEVIERPIAVLGFKDRAQQDKQSQGGVTVGVEILTQDEIEAQFGLPLLGKNIWPVWITVDNRTSNRLLFSPVDFDPGHFSSSEVAWRTRSASSLTFEAQRSELDLQQFPLLVEPGKTASGFVYSDLARGARFFSVVLYSRTETHRFAFGEVAPGFKADFLEVDFDGLTRGHEIANLSQNELRAFIQDLPPTVLGPDLSTNGDPLNIVFVGGGEKILLALGESDWDVSETTSANSAIRTMLSSVFGKLYRTSPVSSLYLFGRRQDMALQKARHSVQERNHMRLWLAPVTFRGQPVWVGQISRDIGVKLTSKTLVTHKISPDVDEARNVLMFNMLQTGWFPEFGFAEGVGEVPSENPRKNYTDDPYFTDGYRLVLFSGVRSEKTDEVRMVDWVRTGEQLTKSDEVRE